MTDPFQIECHQLRARIGRLRRRTDRHLNKLFKPPRLIESMNSFMGSMPLKWAAAAQVLGYILARRKATNEHSRSTLEQAERLLREIAVSLRRFYRVLRSLRSNHRSTSATTTKETTDVRSPDA